MLQRSQGNYFPAMKLMQPKMHPAQCLQHLPYPNRESNTTALQSFFHIAFCIIDQPPVAYYTCVCGLFSVISTGRTSIAIVRSITYGQVCAIDVACSILSASIKINPLIHSFASIKGPSESTS